MSVLGVFEAWVAELDVDSGGLVLVEAGRVLAGEIDGCSARGLPASSAVGQLRAVVAELKAKQVPDAEEDWSAPVVLAAVRN